uniref:Uncharacterized protein n=6 Tax=Pararge aegeria TaxID=116150 RepID=S4PBU5_9NEOP
MSDHAISTSNNIINKRNTSDSHFERNDCNTTYIVNEKHDENNRDRLTQQSVSRRGTPQRNLGPEQHSSTSENQTQRLSHTSDVNSQENVRSTMQSSRSEHVTSLSNQQIINDRQTHKHVSGEHTKNRQLTETSPGHHVISEQDLNSQQRQTDNHIQRTMGSSSNVSSSSHLEQNISKTSSVNQSHTVNRNQLSDSVTKTSIEFQRAMHGGGDNPIASTTSRTGHHKRTSDLVSDSSSTNAVLHRKGVTSMTEAQHSTSSTAAAQRKAITNLNERGEYISNSTQSADRKSISSMHRSTRDNVAVISQHTENIDTRRQEKRDGQSTMVVERQPRVVLRDNLRVGGDFYGNSEARSYGNFSRSNQVDRSERNERVERVERHARHGNTSQFVLGEGGTSYKREFTTHVHGKCPATLIESPRTPFKHTRDSREHKFYTSKITQQTSQ